MAIALAFVCSTLPGKVLAEPVSARTLFSNFENTAPQISPDGKHIATVQRSTFDNAVHIRRLSDNELIGKIPFNDARVEEITWVNKTRIIVVAQVRGDLQYGGAVFEDVLPSFAALSIDLSGGPMLQLTGSRRQGRRDVSLLPVVEQVLPNDPAHVIMFGESGGRVNLYRVNVETGAAEELERGSGNTYAFVTDRTGAPVLRLDYAGRADRMRFGSLVFISNYRPRTVVHARNEAGKWRRVRSFRNEISDWEPNFRPAGRSVSDTTYQVLSHEPAEEFATIKNFNLRTNTYSEILLNADNADVSAAIVDPDTGDVIGGHVWRDTLQAIFFDPDHQADYEALKAKHGLTGNVQYVSATDDFKKIILLVSAPDNPGTYYLYDTEMDEVQNLLYSQPSVWRDSLAKSEVISYPARDGTTLTAYVTHPFGVAADQPAPMVILVHGGPHLRDYFDYDPEVQFLATRGYRVVRPYFRGSTGRGRSFEEAGYGQWADLMQHDVDDAAKYLMDRGLTSPERTCIMGASYGGYSALMGVIQTPDLYACAVATSAVTDLPKQLSHDAGYLERGSFAYKFMKRSLSVPEGSRSLRDRSPVNLVDQITRPILVTHGVFDERIPFEQHETFARRLKEIGPLARTVTVQREGHSGWYRGRLVQYAECVEDFLARHIGGKVYDGGARRSSETGDDLRCPAVIE